LLAWKKNVAGDQNTQLLYNAIITYAAEYGKIIEGSTGSAAGSTDSARRAARELISPALSKGTLPATLDLMNREMGLTMQGYDAVLSHITNRMMGEPGYQSASPTRETVTVPGGVPDGTPVVFPDKSVGYWDATLGRAVRGVKK
jgi:energy-converting hydrogenase Eha subunit B